MYEAHKQPKRTFKLNIYKIFLQLFACHPHARRLRFMLPYINVYAAKKRHKPFICRYIQPVVTILVIKWQSFIKSNKFIHSYNFCQFEM